MKGDVMQVTRIHKLVLRVLLLFGAWSVSVEAAQQHKPAKHSAAAHKFVVTFEETKLEDIVPIRIYLIGGKAITGFLDDLSKAIRLPQDIHVTFKDCEGPDANWDPKEKSITYCYDLIKLYDSGYEEVKDDESDSLQAVLKGTDREAVVLATTMFLLLHEIGHGLVDLFDLPITGREEDAVDQFAALAFLSPDDDPDRTVKFFPLIAANFFRQLDQESSAITRSIFADEHSLGRQRYYNVMCLVLGSDEDTFGPILTRGVTVVGAEYAKDPDDWSPAKIVVRLEETDAMNILPYQRAARCTGEYARFRASWDRITKPLEK